MARRRRREGMPLNAEINVVSLIDVMLLLLVIFMITAPMMQGGVDVALPKAEAKPLEPKSGLVVSVDKAGWIYVDATRMSLREFRSAFRALASKRAKDDGVYLRGDAGVPYGTVTQVLAIMRAAGVGDVGLVTDPEESR
ncbi:MAG: biopolymer transporter ExbD [Gemmatimonadaceae bacterium]